MSTETAQTTNSAPATTEAVAPVVETTAPVTEPVTAAAKPVVPEKYELKLADGSKLSTTAIDEVATLAKAKGWTNEQAQELLDQKQSAVSSFADQQLNELKSLNDTTWKGELMADPEFGGAKFDENMVLVYSAAEKWFGKDGAEKIKASNMNNLPWLAKGFLKLAKASGNDVAVQPGASGGSKPMTEVFYGKPE